MVDFYVYYDEETGALGSISKIEIDEETSPYILLKESIALKFLTGDYATGNFIVDDEELVDTTKNANLMYSNKGFYLIPEGKGGRIHLHYNKGELSITLDETVMKRNFFITDKDDPTVLRKTIVLGSDTVFIKDTVEYPFSVWTNRLDDAKITVEIFDE